MRNSEIIEPYYLPIQPCGSSRQCSDGQRPWTVGLPDVCSSFNSFWLPFAARSSATYLERLLGMYSEPSQAGSRLKGL